MDGTIFSEIEDLRQLKVGALRTKYREVFGEESRSSNKQFLFRRIAWRLQAKVERDLSERVRQRALEIANDADLRIRAPDGFGAELVSTATARGHERDRAQRDWRLPCPGTLLTRQFETARSWSKFWKTGSSIRPNDTGRSVPLPAK